MVNVCPKVMIRFYVVSMWWEISITSPPRNLKSFHSPTPGSHIRRLWGPRNNPKLGPSARTFVSIYAEVTIWHIAVVGHACRVIDITNPPSALVRQLLLSTWVAYIWSQSQDNGCEFQIGWMKVEFYLILPSEAHTAEVRRCASDQNPKSTTDKSLEA